jgi:hypothetical protein
VGDEEDQGPLERQVYVEDRYLPFGELTSDDARRLADKFSGLSGGGREWRQLAKLMDERGAATVAELDAEQVGDFAERLRVIPPGGSWLSS